MLFLKERKSKSMASAYVIISHYLINYQNDRTVNLNLNLSHTHKCKTFELRELPSRVKWEEVSVILTALKRDGFQYRIISSLPHQSYPSLFNVIAVLLSSPAPWQRQTNL